MVTDVLLLWLVAYAGVFAAVGFALVVARSLTDATWSNQAILRLSSGIAFVTALVAWVIVAL